LRLLNNPAVRERFPSGPRRIGKINRRDWTSDFYEIYASVRRSCRQSRHAIAVENVCRRNGTPIDTARSANCVTVTQPSHRETRLEASPPARAGVERIQQLGVKQLDPAAWLRDERLAHGGRSPRKSANSARNARPGSHSHQP